MITNLAQLDLNKQYTYQDYLQWKFEDRVELLRGWIKKMSPAPSRKHQKFSMRLSVFLDGVFKGNTCDVYAAPFDVRLQKKNKQGDPITTVVQPDLCIVCDKTKLDDAGCLGSPDLVIEILSPYSYHRDYHEKMLLYAENDIPEYWIANPDSKSIEIFSLKDEVYVSQGVFVQGKTPTSFQSVIFPNLTVVLEDLFQD